MTTVDPAAMASQMPGAISTLDGIGQQLQQAAPTGRFAQVLAEVDASLSAAVSGQSPGAPPAPSFFPTASLFGNGGTPAGPGSAAAGPGGGQAVVSDAAGYIGVPYQWGGTDPSTGFDCSGFVQHVFADLGVSLPRTSQEQAATGTAVPDLAQAQPGDLVFFDPAPGGPGHVGIYVGNGQMIDAAHTGTAVRVEPVWGKPTAIRRVVGSGAWVGPVPGLAAGAAGGVPASIGAPASLVPLFEAAGQRHGVPPALLAAVAKQESSFQLSATSPAGAQGLMQIMPGTAASLGVDPLDPAQAIDGAATLLGGYLQQYGGSVPLALAAYNAGPGAVARYGGVPPYGETQSYVTSVLGMIQGGGT